jgi:hypothetical protein
VEKRQKKILLLSIFGGGALLLVVGYFAFLLWVLSKAFPNVTIQNIGSNFIELMKCQNQTIGGQVDKECVKAWVTSLGAKSGDKKAEANPEFDICVYQQEILLESLSASKSHGADDLMAKVDQYCDYQINLSPSALAESGYADLRAIKTNLASQAILNYRYKFFKKHNYPLELEALTIYRDIADPAKCIDLKESILDLDRKGSIFNLGSLAVCELKACSDAKEASCPEAVKIAKRMKAAGDMADNFILMHEAALETKDNKQSVGYARQALLKGYTDLALAYPEIEEDFYKIKFNSDNLLFSAARLSNAQKIYDPALNCIAASLNKDWEFEKLVKTPKAYSQQVWADKITVWANDNSDLLLRLACEVLTDIESKKRLHNYYMQQGNEDGSAFDFCSMVKDPLFKDVCLKE